MALLSGAGNPGSTDSIFMSSFFFSKFTLTERTQLGTPDPQFVNQPPSVRHALVARWTRALNTTGPVKIFVPVNDGNSHWFLIMIDVKNKKIWSMDSLRIDRVEHS